VKEQENAKKGESPEEEIHEQESQGKARRPINPWEI